MVILYINLETRNNSRIVHSAVDVVHSTYDDDAFASDKCCENASSLTNLVSTPGKLSTKISSYPF